MLLKKQCRTVVWSVGSRGSPPESTPGDKLLSLPKLHGSAVGIS